MSVLAGLVNFFSSQISQLRDKMPGACADCVDNEQGTALVNAVENEHVQCAKQLILAGADVNIKNWDESPILLMATYKEMHGLVKALLTAGADVNCQNGFTALHVVAEMGHARTMKALIAAGADVNVHMVQTETIDESYDRGGADDEGITALHLCGIPGSSKCVQLLLKSGALVNKRAVHGTNALQHAILPPGGHPIDVPESKKHVILLLFAAGESPYPVPDPSVFPYYQVPKYLKFEDVKLSLKHMCRMAIREYLLKLDQHHHLFGRIPRLGLPNALTQYLLFNMSLDEQYGEEEEEDEDDDE